MKYLLDTHVALWALVKHKRIPKEVVNLLSDSDNQIYYSTASIWEVEIKHLKKPNEIKIDGKQLAALLDNSGAINVPIKNNHIYEIKNLKNNNENIEHYDHFDKLLLSQAISENMIFITADNRLAGYECSNLMII